MHGKGSLWQRMPGDAWNKAANLRALLAYMWAHPGKQLLFQGGEFGQEREWSEQRSLDWHLLDDPLHGGIKTLVGDMNRAYRELPALWTRDVTPDGFSWIDANDSSGNVLSFLRHGVDADGRPTVMACIANFSGSPEARLPGRPAVRRAVARGAQHRRHQLRRLGLGQLRRGRRRAVRLARAARVGRPPAPARRGVVARAGAVRGGGPAVRRRERLGSGRRDPDRPHRRSCPPPGPTTPSPWLRRAGRPADIGAVARAIGRHADPADGPADHPAAAPPTPR